MDAFNSYHTLIFNPDQGPMQDRWDANSALAPFLLGNIPITTKMSKGSDQSWGWGYPSPVATPSSTEWGSDGQFPVPIGETAAIHSLVNMNHHR